MASFRGSAELEFGCDSGYILDNEDGIAALRCVKNRRADIDYGFSEARTTYGVIGIKVWVFKGERLAHGAEPVQAPASAPDAPKRPPRRPPPPGAKNAATS